MGTGHLQRLMAELKEDEGFVPYAYDDANGQAITKGYTVVGNVTIGYGTLIDRRLGGSIDETEAEYLARNRLIGFLAMLSLMPFWGKCSDKRQVALANMAFNTGTGGFKSFKKMIAALNAGDWERAADEMLDSDAARKLPNRYQRLAEMMRSG